MIDFPDVYLCLDFITQLLRSDFRFDEQNTNGVKPRALHVKNFPSEDGETRLKLTDTALVGDERARKIFLGCSNVR